MSPPGSVARPSAEGLPDLTRIRPSLLGWYDTHRRDLPWRTRAGAAADPYRVWVSEVMLQQTRAEVVAPYFRRWLERFPTLQSLAAAPLDEVLKAWEGLGYYSRARNLHRAAVQVAERYGREVPREPAVFRSLPGVGRYTAGAVMSIAFGRPEPVVDGNVRRVFARLVNDPDPPAARMWRLAEALVAGERPGDLNQALMDLGATVCTPAAPRCDRCPIASACAARLAGTQGEVPLPRRAKPSPREDTAVAVVERDGRLLLVRRPVDVRMGGMWELPGTARRRRETTRAAAVRALGEGLGLEGRAGAELGVVEHALTHLRITYRPVRCVVDDGEPRALAYDGFAWARPDDLRDYAIPAGQRRVISLVLRDPPDQS